MSSLVKFTFYRSHFLIVPLSNHIVEKMPKSCRPKSYNNYLRSLKADNIPEIPRSTLWRKGLQAGTRQGTATQTAPDGHHDPDIQQDDAVTADHYQQQPPLPDYNHDSDSEGDLEDLLNATVGVDELLNNQPEDDDNNRDSDEEFSQPSTKVILHYKCPVCESYLGEDLSLDQAHFTAKRCYKSKDYFLTSSVEQQLKNNLEGTNLWDHIEKTKSNLNAPARAKVVNYHQHNGEFGCGYCLERGKRVPKGDGTVQIYPLVNPLPPCRTHASTLALATDAINNPRDPIKKEISQSEIQSAKILIHKFISEIPHLYGEEQCTYNVHVLQHIPDSQQLREYARSFIPLAEEGVRDLYGKLDSQVGSDYSSYSANSTPTPLGKKILIKLTVSEVLAIETNLNPIAPSIERYSHVNLNAFLKVVQRSEDGSTIAISPNEITYKGLIDHTERFPDIINLALTKVAIPASSAAAERLFSVSGWHCIGRKIHLEKANLAAKRSFRVTRIY
ncbi:hypothetical protein OUZ56_012554 [Daphnia magna]|uniref:HAT C-terminal dimerisation domain-containing protein n=1 Tax=Daphnia magna TaxID=35525 RepID=A0ABQ9Z3C7_9CRUS|nr:hypothetical protein OUZ56_012554 [Daphnia magna]